MGACHFCDLMHFLDLKTSPTAFQVTLQLYTSLKKKPKQTMTMFPRFFLWRTLLTRYLLTHVIYFIPVCRWKPWRSSGFHPNLHDFRCMGLTTLFPTFRERGSGGQKGTCQDIGYLARVSASVSRSLAIEMKYSKFCVLLAGSYLGEWGRGGVYVTLAAFPGFPSRCFA